VTGLTQQVALAATATPAIAIMVRRALTRAMLGSREGTRRCPSSCCLIDEHASEHRTRSDW
jgi:hypothetical protein